tara:strand:- start:2934 stop:3767 length:834 start_codon:yes stop_codon:yes gene_type:complete
MSYKDPKRKVGSQKELPFINEELNIISVIGYQKFTINKSSLEIKSKPKFEKINKILETIKYKRSFCDIGCSSGIVSILAHKNKFENITAIDHDPEYTNILKIINNKLEIKNINVITDSFGNDKNKYDVVFCGAIIHWIWSLTSNFNSFEKILNYLNNITNKILLIEWISENDNAINIIMNYLDLLTDDLVEKILDNVVDDIDKQISLLNRKINKLNKDLNYLIIDKFEEIIIINYVYVSYCIGEYLFSKFESNKDIVLINIYDDYFGEGDGNTYESV